jgi:hypothetical protein
MKNVVFILDIYSENYKRMSNLKEIMKQILNYTSLYVSDNDYASLITFSNVAKLNINMMNG